MYLKAIRRKIDHMQFIHLDSIDDERVSAYTNLTEIQLRNKLEPSKGLFIAESPKVIDRALTADREPISLLVEEPWIGGMSETFARRIAVMENIVDHTNVGALMRSAAALNVDAVLVTPSCGDPLYRRAARVSMGTVFQIPWTRIGGDDKHYWPFTGMQELRDLGFTTVAMALEDDSISLEELVRRLNNDNGEKDHIDKLALIFGTEGDGLSHHTISRADLTVKIPMSHGVDSLNVAASSAVAFYSTAVH